jgi:hypothetical protein
MSDAGAVARDQLRSFVERIERLEEEKKTIADDIKDVYGEAKAHGIRHQGAAQGCRHPQAGRERHGLSRKQSSTPICTRWAWRRSLKARAD